MSKNLPERAWTEFDLAVKSAALQLPRDDKSKYSAIINRAMAAAKNKRYSEAIEDFNTAEASQPNRWRDDWLSYYSRGLTLLLAKQPERAVADLSQAALLKKDDAEQCCAIYLWIWDVHRSSGSLAQADEVLQLAADAAKEDKRMANIVGHCKGEVERSTLLKDAASDSKKESVAYYYIALAAKARGNIKDAMDCFEACRKLDAAGRPEREYFAEMQLASLRASQ